MLQGKVALVTGANRGIGRQIALEFAKHGAVVAVNYIDDPASAAEVVRDMGSGIALFADVSKSADVEQMVDTIVERLGGIDIVVNNAGIQTFGPLLEVDEADWDRVLATNLKGTFLCTQRAARRMKNRGWGRIINIGSGSNKVAFPRLVAYTASRGGIEMFTKVAAVELGPLGITVNCLAPGAIETERTKLESPGYAETWASLTPLARIGQPLDVARAAVFLASDDAAFITGQTLWIDGGLFAKPAWPY